MLRGDFISKISAGDMHSILFILVSILSLGMTFFNMVVNDGVEMEHKIVIVSPCVSFFLRRTTGLPRNT